MVAHPQSSDTASQLTPDAAVDTASAKPLSVSTPRPLTSARTDVPTWLATILLGLILLIGGYFRFLNLDWDSGQHLHPDERFMTNVADAIRPTSISLYFDTAQSTLNPFPYGSFTYGMFPLFLTRYIAELLNKANYSDLTFVGRGLSAVFDLAAVAMLFFLGARLYDRRVGLLASGLYAAAVLPIQLSHYFAVDSFATVFIVAAFYIAAPVMDSGRRRHYAIFGLLTGLAMACKINTAPLEGIIVVAGSVRLVRGWRQNEDRKNLFKEVLVGWLIAAGVTALTFRVFQPYAFSGPTIFGISLNQRWLDIMREVTDQVAGRSEWPPNHHWTNRSQLTFAWIQNAVWGLGLPLGLTATIGWVWATWRTWSKASVERGAWQSHLLLVAWVGAYFVWQNSQFWRYMRYFMPIYPLAILLGAWALTELFDRMMSRPTRTLRELRQTTVLRILAILVIAAVTLSTYAYAFAFTRIYTRTHTRVAASRWMLANLPGPLDIHIDTGGGTRVQPLAVPYDLVLGPGGPWHTQFEPMYEGSLTEITTYRLYTPDTLLDVKLSRDAQGADVITQGSAAVPAMPPNASQSVSALFQPVTLSAGQTYYLQYSVRGAGDVIATGLSLANDRETTLEIEGEIASSTADQVGAWINFTPQKDTSLDRLNIGSISTKYPSDTSTIRLTLSQDNEGNQKLAETDVTINLTDVASSQTFSLSPPVPVKPGTAYFIKLEVTSGAPLQAHGTTLALETGWDDALPLRIDGYDPLGGIYRINNLELYEPDTAIKRARMLDMLSRSDYLVISSNRAYDAMPRLPLRYPLTLKYYQALFNCSEQLIIRCAYPAQPPLTGPLGYELVQVFESNPSLGPFEFSDQAAEEAFTVYDHPKVMIFKRTSDYSPEQAAEILNSVDLTQVVEQSPAQYTAMPGLLRLTPDRLEAQTEGGTWSALFDRFDMLNTYQPLGVAAWYLLLLLLGWSAWPLVFHMMPGLYDRGYPLSKLIGLLIVTWAAWFSASYRLVTFSRPILWLIVTLLIFVGGFFAYRNWSELSKFTRERRQYILVVEIITLSLFLFFLWVRWLNPDLWHPWLGGEKPADYSFFLSTVKSVYFPPYDAWLAGHYVNYYYYGYVIAAVPTKLLGILPSIAYNLVLPMFFAFGGIGAFCAAYNLVAASVYSPRYHNPATPTHPRLPLLAGVAALVMMMLLGNLYQVRQLWQYLPEAADPPAPASSDLIEHTGNVLNGAWRVITGQSELPGEKGRWYFGASRAILHDGPDTPITEFPFFSFLYADLHPHLTSMSLMLAALAWMMSVVFAADQKVENHIHEDAVNQSEDSPTGAGPSSSSTTETTKLWPRLESVLLWFAAGLIFGALQPTQTWDFPGFMLLGLLAIIASTWLRRPSLSRSTFQAMIVRTALFVGLALVMYYPFRQWFGTQYTQVEFWKFTRTPLIDYFTVHGLFLFVIVTFLVWHSRAWLRRLPLDFLLNTPLGELLPRIRTHLYAAGTAIVIGLVGMVALWLNDYHSVLFAVGLLAWVAIMFFWRGQSLPIRLWSVIVGAGAGLTILVELITLRGDLGRANTVFKFYIEVWLFFSVAAGAALAWLVPALLREWPIRLRRGWLAGLALLGAAAATYTFTGVYAKVTDRWPEIDAPPRTLDGMAYMLGSVTSGKPAVYNDEGALYNLVYDYGAMQWMQDNIVGTPAIVEGTSPLYRWGSRFAIYTGLPTVVGWDYHVSQHDSVLPGSVITNRVNDVRQFYDSTDPETAMGFLKRYDVQYIVIGALERKYYAAEGLAKFTVMAESGQLELVFPPQPLSNSETTLIYRLFTAGEH